MDVQFDAVHRAQARHTNRRTNAEPRRHGAVLDLSETVTTGGGAKKRRAEAHSDQCSVTLTGVKAGILWKSAGLPVGGLSPDSANAPDLREVVRNIRTNPVLLTGGGLYRRRVIHRANVLVIFGNFSKLANPFTPYPDCQLLFDNLKIDVDSIDFFPFESHNESSYQRPPERIFSALSNTPSSLLPIFLPIKKLISQHVKVLPPS
ncbi:hypothetical protein [Pandoraea pulmonicola]|uniref:hypothetical protein n=1 Tax=Pandoraea pulmonicola TaxID=93221 RepID=UPI0011C07C20|nr:hypothetical protein [Pandoraea pulmonicola]